MFDIPLESAEDAGHDGGVCFQRFVPVCPPGSGKFVRMPRDSIASVARSLLAASTALHLRDFTFKLLRVSGDWRISVQLNVTVDY